MLEREVAAQDLEQVRLEIGRLSGLGGSVLRERIGVASTSDLERLAHWEGHELRDERNKAWARLRARMDAGLGAGILKLLAQVSAITGHPPDDPRVRKTLMTDCGLGETESSDALLRAILRVQRLRDAAWFVWEPYERWNRAIADVFFGIEHAGGPVYLDIEEETLRRAAGLVWPPADFPSRDTEAALCLTVARTLDLDRGGPAMLDLHEDRAAQWVTRNSETRTDSAREPEGDPGNRPQAGNDEPPSCVALLALFSLAAERMRSDDDLAATSYYGRLAELLGRPPEQSGRIGQEYRRHSLFLWDCLNFWLGEAGGQRGLPTAMSFGHQRFISLPISQALIRAEERARLPEFFAAYRFNPGQQVAREDMQELLNAWIPGHGMGNLQSLWRRSGEARRRVADIVCTELEHWRGDNSVSEVDDQRELTALIAATYFDTPERLFEPMLALRETADIDDLLGAYHTLGGEDVTALRDPGGMIRLTRGDAVADQALLVSALAGNLYLTQEGSGTSLARQGRRVTVLLLDQLHQQYIESARTELGRELLLLADSLVVGELCRVLEQVAEPGFTVVQSGLAGLPEGWALITGIRLHSLPEQADGVLEPLRPRSRTQVEFDGGMQLSDGRWHASSAPAVIAVDGAGREFRVTLYRQSSRTGDEPIDLGAHQAEARIPLSDRGLENGNYRVVLTAAAGGAHLTSRSLKLRSSRTAHLDPPVQLRLEHGASPDFDPRAALSAEEPSEQKTTSLRGVIFNRHEGLRAVPDANLRDSWGGMEPFGSLESLARRISGEATEQGIELAREFRRRGFITEQKGRLELTEAGHRHLDSINPPSNDGTGPPSRVGGADGRFVADLDRILDALVVSQAGSWNSFRRLIDYSESERFAPHEAMRNLRGLGHIDVEVDARSMYPRRWSLTPAAMVVMPDRTSAVLTGRRSPQIVDALLEAVERCGGAFIRSAAPARPERVELTAADPGVLGPVHIDCSAS